MAAGRIIVLSALFVQALSAPSGCIESCNFYESHSSYQSRQTSGGHLDHAGLIQGTTNLNEHNYVRPGNWTEHNQYDTNNGHGKVHEERGQYVEGSKRVRYYKKNSTSSYGTGNMNGVGAVELDRLNGHREYDSVHIPNSQHLDSQSAYNQVGATSVTKESGYSRMHSQQTQSSSRKIDGQSERLEDFGEYGGYSQVNQRVPSQTSDTNNHAETIPQNWSRVDSYKTDGGHGRVFEEEGQFVTGPKKVRYYKKNYTSSYSTSGVPQMTVGSTTLQDLHQELQQNLHKHLDDFRREIHQTSNVGQVTSVAHTDFTPSLTQETVGLHSDDLQTAESDTYRQQLTHHRVPSTGTVHYADQQQRETFTADTRQYTPSYTYPSMTADTYGTESQRTHQSHETYVSRIHPTSQPTHLSHLIPVLSSTYIQRPVIRDDYQSSLHNVHSSGLHAVDDTQRAIVSDSLHQTNVAQNQLFAENSQRVYHPSPDRGIYPSRRGQATHYEEHWSSSSRTGGNLYPDRSASYDGGHGADRTHYDRVAYNEHLGRYHNAAQGYSSQAHTSDNTYNSGYRTTSGQLVTGSMDLGHVAHGAADCTDETQHYQQESRYHRKYKRDDHHGFVDEHQRRGTEHDDLTQQHQEFSQESQQMEGLTSADLTQQTQGFGQRTLGNHHLEDFTQQTAESDDLTKQTSGKLEFGQHIVDSQHLEDLTQQSEQIAQQTSGKLEFGQQTAGNQHPDFTQQSEQFTQQTEGSDDFMQQTSGKLEFGQQTMNNKHLEDLTQQTEDQLEFGQRTIGNQHWEDLTKQGEQQFEQQTAGSDDFSQQSVNKLKYEQRAHDDSSQLENLTQQIEQLSQRTERSNDFTQQTNGKLELGQKTIGGHHLEDLTQQTEQFGQQTIRSDDFTQQTNGKLELGQQTIGGQHLEDLIQQTEQFGQQTIRSDDFTQQTSGKLELGQQTIGGQHLEDLTQQTEQFGHQTIGSDDFTQQTNGNLELGQQTIGDQHLEDLTQQTEQSRQQTTGSDDFTQQTNGKLELGQQTIDEQHLEDLIQRIEQFGQQTTGSDDFTQQTNGKLELGQQTIDGQHLEDLTQQTEQFGQQTIGSDDCTQQTNGKLELGQQTIGSQHLEDLTQQTEQFGQHMIRSDDFTQQTSGKLELGQQTSGSQHLEDLTQQTGQFGQQTTGTDDFTQQSGQLKFGQHVQAVDKLGKPKNQHLEEFNHQKEDFDQQTEGSDELTQQTMGHLELGQQTQQPHRSGNQGLEDFTQQNEDWTQQVGEFHDFTQQTMGHLEFGQQTQQQQQHRFGNQHLEDFTQQNEDFLTQQVSGFDDLTQQTTGHLEHGQQREQQWKPGRSRYDTQYSEHLSQQSGWNEESEWQLGQMSQKTDFNQDFTQQTDHDGQLETIPASKPKPRQRYPKYSSNPSHTDTNIEDVSKPIEINSEANISDRGRDGGNVQYGSHATHPKSNDYTTRTEDLQSQGNNGFDNEKENIDRLHWVHKSNDATVGLQWHYTYHPSDLTNVESSHNIYYPKHNSMSQQTEQQKPVDFTQQETKEKHTLDFSQQETQNKHTFETSTFNSQFDQNSEYIPSEVIPLQHGPISQQTAQLNTQSNQAPGQAESKFESRILEVYGGGPYASRNDDIYRRVTPNPSATLPPIYGEEAWDVREKPRGRDEIIPWSIARNKPTTNKVEDVSTAEMAETTTQIIETTTKEEAPPSFWTRVGNKITNTYGKAKEKAREIFG